VTSAILFGLDLPDFACKVGAMIDHWVHMNHQMGMGAFVSDPSFIDNYDSLLAQAAELETEVQQMIHLRRTSSEQGNDVLSLLIRAHEEEGRLNDAELVGHITLLFGAAHLTTAHTLTWTLFLLAQHPEIMRGVSEEIDDWRLAIDDSSCGESSMDRKLPLMERVIKESMRVLPASSYSQRITAEPVELGPFRLSPGSPVIFSQFVTHHLEKLYPEPERFLPDRWLTISPSPYAYLPFGAGPRMCLGAPLAMMILKSALPMILKRFRLSVVPGAEVSGTVISTMLGPTTSVPMLLAPPDGRFHSSPVCGNIHSMVQLPDEALATAGQARRAA
jgi:cytochrome P450